MSAVKHINTRHEPKRFRLHRDSPIKLLDLAGHSVKGLRPIDVSRRGFGFMASHPMEPGVQMTLAVKDKVIKVEVAYCHSHLGIENMFRCGVFVRDPEENLETLFTNLGFIVGPLAIEDYY